MRPPSPASLLRAGPSPPAQLSSATQATIHKRFAQLVQDNGGYGGGVLRIESIDRGLLYEGAWGKIEHGGHAPMEPATPFEVASITKMFTATAMMLLVAQGPLPSLSSTVATAAPRLVATLRPPPHWHNVTLRQLLQHRSGLDDYWKSQAFVEAFEANEDKQWDPLELLSFAKQMPPLPHDRFSYSDTNYVLAGLVVEEAAGKRLGDVFQELILAPLGMTGTYFNHVDRATTQTPLVVAHRYEGREDLTTKARQSADWAGGGLVSTTADLSRFLLRGLVQGRLGGGGGPLSPQLKEEMLREPVATETEGVRYGLGAFVVDASDELGDEEDGLVWGHDGWGNAFLWFHPGSGVVLSGTVNQHDDRADHWPAVMAALKAVRHELGGSAS